MTPSDERRNGERFAAYKKLFLNVLSCPAHEERTGETYTCTSMDVSGKGVRLLVDKHVPEESEVEVWVKPIDPPDPLALRAKVVWCRQADDTGFYWIGLELTHDRTEDLEIWSGLFQENTPA